MSASTSAMDARPRPADVLAAWGRRNAWVVGLLCFLVLLLAFTRFIQPNYGVAGVRNLGISVLPLALAAVALTSVVSATLMKGQSEEIGVVVVVGVLLLGILLGAINGALVVVTRVPDIVVTLAMSFVWAGAALLVLKTPGGGSAAWLKDLVSGSFLNEWVPKAAVVLIVIVAVVWIPLRRSRLGLSIYAIGSNRLAAFRSSVAVSRTRIVAYALTGLFAALGGLSLTASTGIATPVPGPYTLLSVAAIVLGGVTLAGGRGGVFGPILAVVILQLIRTDMTFLNINTNLAVVAQGVILIGVVMIGSLIQIRRANA